ncbi:expressed unknown protein [Seminavis robusta]|uniref:Glyoxalase-like domain-containing protein n=1 Tax=Seminavis robusta TaxID=568900 RepID=A0A9N8DYJ3_9STRA|nr:expressed unknown protein [Seminavis robusta]|eukprot:Sro344_g122280.1 n/a (243) ;mRNA; f:55812-56540
MAPFVRFLASAALAGTSQHHLSIDHLVYVTPDLESAIQEFEDKTGVRPTKGGRHLGLGTHNAFLALGNGRYLELFAPDPEAEVPLQTIIGVDGPKPRLSTFCCRSPGIETLIQHFQSSIDDVYKDLLPQSVESGSRTNEADGTTISWRIASEKHAVPSEELPMGGLLPFYIDWGDSFSVHPSKTAPQGCTLLTLEAFHPEPEGLTKVIKAIGSNLEDLLIVKDGDDPQLVATLDTPNGIVTL